MSSLNGALRPLFRLALPANNDHLYTCSTHEREHLRTHGWVDEGQTGTLFADSAPGRRPLYRLYKGGYHAFTHDASERQTLLGRGFADEGILGYVLDQKHWISVQAFLFQAPAGEYVLTTNPGERDGLSSAGWKQLPSPGWMLPAAGQMPPDTWSLDDLDIQTHRMHWGGDSAFRPGAQAPSQSRGPFTINNGTDRRVTVGHVPAGADGAAAEFAVEPGGRCQVVVNLGDAFTFARAGDAARVGLDAGHRRFVSYIHSNPALNAIDFDLQEPLMEAQATVAGVQVPGIDTSHKGFDLARIDPKCVSAAGVTGFVFDKLNADDRDWSLATSNVIVKHGFSYADNNIKRGSERAKVVESFSRFSVGFSANVSVEIPVPQTPASVSPSLGFSHTRSAETSESDVFVYARRVCNSHTVEVDVEQAALSVEFTRAVLALTAASEVEPAIIRRFGTHYARSITYGGDYNRHYRMTSREHIEASSTKVDVGLGLQVADAGFEVDLTNETQTETRDFMSNREVYESMMGGAGDFSDDWMADKAAAVAVEVELVPLYELVHPKVFKDAASEVELARQRRILAQGIATYLDRELPMLGAASPKPRMFRLTLKALRSYDTADDSNHRTRGFVWGQPYFADGSRALAEGPASELSDDVRLAPAPAVWSWADEPPKAGVVVIGTSEWRADERNDARARRMTFWRQDGYSGDFEWTKTKEVGKTYTFAQYPGPDGGYRPLYALVGFEITEGDNLLPAEFDARYRSAFVIRLDGDSVTRKRTVDVEASFFQSLADRGKLRAEFEVDWIEPFAANASFFDVE